MRTGDAFLDASGWHLLDYPAEISKADFRLTETGVQWEIDLSASGKITEKAVGHAEQYNLDLIDIGWTEHELCQWLERKTRQQDITQSVLLEFVRRAMAYLIEKRALPLTSLVRWRFILAKVLAEKIGSLPGTGERRSLSRNTVRATGRRRNELQFPVRFCADGLRSALDLCQAIPISSKGTFTPLSESWKTKARNTNAPKPSTDGESQTLGSQSRTSRFFVALATAKFYPDFVAELTDGRILALEHKGKVYATNDDSKEKCNVGALWERQAEARPCS